MIRKEYCSCKKPIMNSKWKPTGDPFGTIFLSYFCERCGKLDDEANNILYG